MHVFEMKFNVKWNVISTYWQSVEYDDINTAGAIVDIFSKYNVPPTVDATQNVTDSRNRTTENTMNKTHISYRP